MRAFANSFKDQFVKDDEVMQSISKSQEINMIKTTEERDKLAEVNKSTVSSFFKRLFMLLIATVTFCFMFMFIWMFPNKV